MKNREFVITAAGGNGTAIRVLTHALSRKEYAREGEQLGRNFEKFGAEQAGFLVISDDHFEMGGGEFCGNAARSAAILFSEIKGDSHVSFTISGFDGEVQAVVEKKDDKHYFVECVFRGMPTESKNVVLSNGQRVTVVDLGGIVHVVIEASFNPDRKVYEAAHREITRELGFENRSAVGVVWIERNRDSVIMKPVVWVKEVNTFFFESSCGSGTIAVGKVTGAESVVQPTGQIIHVKIEDGRVILRSEMEVAYESA